MVKVILIWQKKIPKVDLHVQTNKQCCTWLCSIYPAAISSRTHYLLRNALDRDIIARRTEIFANSFIPSSVTLCNSLPPETKSLLYLSLFKSNILQMFNVSSIHEYYLVCERNMSVLHTRLRNKCSGLNLDLFNNHVTNSPSCTCGHFIESAEHYFFQC